MRIRRLLAAAAATSCAAATVLATIPARADQTTTAAAPAGNGTARAATSVVQVGVGQDSSVLSLRLLGDDSSSTIDKTVAGAPSALTRLTAIDLKTPVQALNVTSPPIEARAPGGNGSVTSPAVPLSTPASTGTIDPASLTAVVDGAGATSGLTSSVSNLSLVGGLLSVAGADSNLGTKALAASADGLRGLRVDHVSVLDLGALLDGLGIGLDDLPVGVVSSLLGQLHLPVPGLDQGVGLQQAVTTLQGAITQVQGLLTTTATTIDTTVNQTVGGIVGQVGGVIGQVGGSVPGGQPVTVPTVPSVGSAVATLNDTLDDLKTALNNLLNNALTVLDGTALLSADGLEAGLTTKAADTVANSVAEVTAKVGSLSVGGVAIPGLDLGATADQVSQLVGSVTGAVSGVLGAVDPGLANLVSLKTLEQTKSVTSSNGYTHAAAGLTLLTASVTPPTDLGAIVGRVLAAPGVNDVLSGLGLASLQALPTLDGGMGQLSQALGTVQALSGGVTVKVGDLVAASDFQPASVAPPPAASPAPAPATPDTPAAAPAPAPAPTGDLPRTGEDALVLIAFGLLLTAAGLGLPRWLRRTTH